MFNVKDFAGKEILRQAQAVHAGLRMLALDFKSRGRPPFLVAADVYRPAADEQLRTLGGSIEVPVFGLAETGDRAIDQRREIVSQIVSQ